MHYNMNFFMNISCIKKKISLLFPFLPFTQKLTTNLDITRKFKIITSNHEI